MKEVVKFTFDHDRQGKPTTKFFINEEKGTVVCKITGRLKGFGASEIERNYFADWDVPGFEDVIWNNGEPVYIMSFKGKAKCAADDKFNEKIGRQIAESRAKMKVYAFIQQLAQKSAEEYERAAKTARFIEEKYLNILAVEAGRVEKLTD